MVALYIFRREFKLYFIYNNIPTKFALLQAHIVWEGWRRHLNDLEHTNAHYMLNILAFLVVAEILEKNQPYLRIFFYHLCFRKACSVILSISITFNQCSLCQDR